MCFNQTGDISTLNGGSQKLVDKSTYLGSSVSSTESNINMCLAKAWTAIDRLSIIWKSDIFDKIKRNLFQTAIVLVLLYGYTTWTLAKRFEKKLDRNCTGMLQAISNKSWKQHPTKKQLYCLLPPHHHNHLNNTNKTCGTQLEKQGRTHKFYYEPLNIDLPVLADQP